MHLAKDVKIPDVYNMTVDEAIDTIKNVGLSVADDIEYASSDSIADGNVITQSPKAGTRISKDQKVELVVSTGSSGGDVEVPDVTGMEFDEAIKALSDKNLNYAVIEDYSDSVDMGEVIRQSPLKGTKLNEHDEVTLHISKGKTSAAPTEGPSATKVAVPSLNGETKESAEAKLQEAGLVRGAISYKYSESMENFIISQSPETGKLVDPGSKVNIVISRGSKSDSEEADDEEAQEKKTETKTETKATAKPSDEDEETEKSSSKKQEFTVKIPDGAGDTVNVEIVANGKTVHNDMHDKSEGSVTVTIEGEGSVKVQAYIDGAKVADKTLEFD
jgi:serine/threonine-protein kinase